MSEPSLFPDETQERLFQAARAAAADFIPLMISILTGLTTPTLTGLRRAVRRGLVPAEAIARRMIWVLAGQLASAAPPRAPHAPRPSPSAPTSSATRRTARKPRTFRALRLTEPQPRTGAATRLAPIRAAAPGPRPPADIAALVTKLRLRMNGLLRAIAEPEAEARRLLRLRARAAKATKSKTPPFAPGAPMVPDHPTVPRSFVLRLENAAVSAWRRLTPQHVLTSGSYLACREHLCPITLMHQGKGTYSCDIGNLVFWRWAPAWLRHAPRPPPSRLPRLPLIRARSSTCTCTLPRPTATARRPRLSVSASPSI